MLSRRQFVKLLGVAPAVAAGVKVAVPEQPDLKQRYAEMLSPYVEEKLEQYAAAHIRAFAFYGETLTQDQVVVVSAAMASL